MQTRKAVAELQTALGYLAVICFVFYLFILLFFVACQQFRQSWLFLEVGRGKGLSRGEKRTRDETMIY